MCVFRSPTHTLASLPNAGGTQVKGVKLRDTTWIFHHEFEDIAKCFTITYWDQLKVCFSLCVLEICLCGNFSLQRCSHLAGSVMLCLSVWQMLSEVLCVYSTTGSRKLEGNAKIEMFVTLFWGGRSFSEKTKRCVQVAPSCLRFPINHNQSQAGLSSLPAHS